LINLKSSLIFLLLKIGDKIGSTIIAQSVEVPTISWNGDDIRVDYDLEEGFDLEVLERANVKTSEEARDHAERLVEHS